MGIRERYQNGVFSWVDLVTTEPDAAKHFYSNLFGWEFQDIPIPDGTVYSMARYKDRNVAALYLMPDSLRQLDIPPHWDSYITVDDLEASVQSWQENGGTLVAAPFDVLDDGRMAVVQDPTGATVNLWQAKATTGAGIVNEANTFCWTELQTRDAERAIQFYQAVFGWDIEVEAKPPYYVTGKVQGRYNCGMFDMDKASLPAHIPPHWAVYFNVADLDGTLAQARSLGAEVLMEPILVDAGRFATIADPQGATFLLIELTVVDD
jgi:hypothetical protein